jgi:hypothetical protein
MARKMAHLMDNMEKALCMCVVQRMQEQARVVRHDFLKTLEMKGQG